MTNRTSRTAVSSKAMPEKPTWEQIEQDRDKPEKLPLDPVEAMRALLKVDPDSEPRKSEGNRRTPPKT